MPLLQLISALVRGIIDRILSLTIIHTYEHTLTLTTLFKYRQANVKSRLPDGANNKRAKKTKILFSERIFNQKLVLLVILK